MRQNTTSPRPNLPFQCFHTCTAPDANAETCVLFVRGAEPSRLECLLAAFPELEAVFTPMRYTGSRSGIHRFEADLPFDEGSNLQFYGFKIILKSKDGDAVTDAVWYSSLGMSRECPLLQHCFAIERVNQHPDFVPDLICYQIFPDRFASAKGCFVIDAQKYPADEPIHANEFEYKDLNSIHCGGDLDGVVSMLPYIRGLGCDGVYLTPIFKAPSISKYDTEDYDVIDPHFGGNGALKRLRSATLGYEMRLLLNGPFNHTGDMHPWFDRQERTGKGAHHHEDSPFRDFYNFRENGEPVYWKNSPALPKLNYASRSVRQAMFKSRNSVLQKWLKLPYGIDGWCLDAAAQIGDEGTAKNNVKRLHQMCKAARDAHPGCLMLGQFSADARYVLNTDNNLDGAVNYTGFLSPMRAFFGGVDLKGVPIPYTGEDLRRTLENYSVGMPQQVKLCQLNQLDNHSLPRFFKVIGGEKNLYLAALAVLYTWRGIPCIYQGDELGDVINQYEIGPRSPVPFKAMADHHVSPYSARVQNTMAELAAMRRANPALTVGSLVFICAGGAYFGYIRLYQNRFAIVLVNASRQTVKIEQGSILFPLLAAMYLPSDAITTDDISDSGESLLIPLSGRNVRRTDHGEGLEGLYEMLAREKLQVSAFGFTKSSDEFTKAFLEELTQGRTITIPARTTIVVNNSAETAAEAEGSAEAAAAPESDA